MLGAGYFLILLICNVCEPCVVQGIIDEHNDVAEELSLLLAQVEAQLSSERSKNSTLLTVLEGVPLKTELSLLKDNQQIVLQLQQTEDKVKVCLQWLFCASIQQAELSGAAFPPFLG